MEAHDNPVMLRALLEAAVDGIVISEAGGRILRANAAAAGMVGRDATEMEGACTDLLVPDAGTIAPGSSREVEAVRADGSTLPVRLSAGRAETDHGSVVVWILRDLTAERALQQAVARSERMDAIGRMTGGISHDFNNLLTVVIGNLELLESARLTDRQRKQLRDALVAAELGVDLTSRLTVFARQSDLRAVPVDMNGQMDQALGLLRHTIGVHCRIEARPQPDVWPVALDPAQLQTAILNLALNSQDAMPEGGLLTIEVHNIDISDSYVAQELFVEPGRYVRLSVSDTGHGMRPEDRTRALEPFYTTKPVGHGTGLGLSMVYGFVRQSGGHLTIYSEPGQGTVVALYFPVGQVAVPAADDTAEDRTAGVPHASGGRRILIVEDDERLRDLTAERLAGLGFSCLAAGSADAAWDMLSAGADVALVFTDMVMPGKMTGFDLAQRIAAERPEIAVLLTSGFSESVLRERGISDGRQILRKPYRQADLERAIYAVLDRG